MCGCGEANDAASKKTETKPGACADCEAADTGSVEWEKQPGATDEDMEKAKKQWADAKSRRLPDGSKPKTVEAMEALEKSDKKTTIKVGDEGNHATPGSGDWANAKDGNGDAAVIHFDPDKKGNYTDGTARDPESSLAHESFHAYEITQGALSTDDNWVEQAEKGAGGAENEHRAAKGEPQRSTYGSAAWPLEQYTPPAE